MIPTDPQRAQIQTHTQTQTPDAGAAVLTFPYATAAAARRVERAIAPETDALDDARSQVTLTRDGHTVELRIRAADRTALRASLNTWFGLVEAAEHAGDATPAASQ